MLRKLKTSDIFHVSRIFKKMNLKIDTVGKSGQQVGNELIITAFENLHLAEAEVIFFFADLSGMSQEEFSNLELEKTFEIINEFKNISGISSFLTRAGQLTT